MNRIVGQLLLAASAIAVLVIAAAAASPPLAVDPTVLAEEARRVGVVERISRSTVAIFEHTATNGGSGVIVSDDGLVVTNFHVTAPCGALMLVGTNDGRVHEAVLLGLDPTGDIALIRLLGDGPWPAAALGDSDRVRVGDGAIVAGNPFLLAEDFSPSISVGVISGVGRYQYPSKTVLEYADCLQTDAAINPGNSGGPLFDAEGRLIGINGRGSFEKRGRVNVGVGYAVSINQVKRFITHLATGRIVDHATLGATVATRNGPQTIVTAIEVGSDAYRRGLRPGDEVVSLGGRDTPTANALLNAVGVLPAGWRTALEYRRDGRLLQSEVRLGSLHAPGELEEAAAEATPSSATKGPKPPADLYEARDGFANYAAQRAETRRLLKLLRREEAASESVSLTYSEAIRNEPVKLRFGPHSAEWLAPSGEFSCDPRRDLTTQFTPPAAPGLLGALWVSRCLAAGEEGLLDRVEAFGKLPWQAAEPAVDVLVATHRGLRVEVFVDSETGTVRGVEASRDATEDRVRVSWDEPATGWAPKAMTVHHGDRRVASLTISGEGAAP